MWKNCLKIGFGEEVDKKYVKSLDICFMDVLWYVLLNFVLDK